MTITVKGINMDIQDLFGDYLTKHNPKVIKELEKELAKELTDRGLSELPSYQDNEDQVELILVNAILEMEAMPLPNELEMVTGLKQQFSVPIYREIFRIKKMRVDFDNVVYAISNQEL